MKKMILTTVVAVLTTISLMAQPATKPVAIPVTTPATEVDKPCCMGDLPDLTQDQITKIEALKVKLEKEMIPLKSSLQVKIAELGTLVVAEKPDITLINKKIDEIMVIKTQMAKLHIAHRQDVRALLTDAQKVVFDMKFLNMEDKMFGGDCMGGHPGKCGGAGMPQKNCGGGHGNCSGAGTGPQKMIFTAPTSPMQQHNCPQK